MNDSKPSLNVDYYEKFTSMPSEMIVHKTPKLDLPSVTKILNITMSAKSKTVLENWKKGMIENLGEDGFNKYTKGKIYIFKTVTNLIYYLILV